MTDKTDWYIDIDCPPGPLRPNAVLQWVLQGSSLAPEDFDNTGRTFGNWTFVPKPEKLDEYGTQRNHIKARIIEAYEHGFIRYGSW